MRAFSGCRGLTSVTIPNSVTSIGENAFQSCLSLQSIEVVAGNQEYTSVGGVLFDAAQTLVIQYPSGTDGAYTILFGVTSIGAGAFSGCSGLTSVAIPSGVTSVGKSAFSGCRGLPGINIPLSVTSIGDSAFNNCSGLSSVTIPSGVTSVGNLAFSGCRGLAKAAFLGNSPSFATGVFSNTAPGFTIYYLSSSTGFTSPIWKGYPATMNDEAIWPAAPWLLENGLWYDTDLHQDTDSDGVSLLMAYALNLDPRINLRGSLPLAVLNGNTLSLSFHATSPGITYRAETSTDLKSWTTSGVTQSTPGLDQRSTATVPLGVPSRFFRLAVED